MINHLKKIKIDWDDFSDSEQRQIGRILTQTNEKGRNIYHVCFLSSISLDKKDDVTDFGRQVVKFLGYHLNKLADVADKLGKFPIDYQLDRAKIKMKRDIQIKSGLEDLGLNEIKEKYIKIIDQQLKEFMSNEKGQGFDRQTSSMLVHTQDTTGDGNFNEKTNYLTDEITLISLSNWSRSAAVQKFDFTWFKQRHVDMHWATEDDIKFCELMQHIALIGSNISKDEPDLESSILPRIHRVKELLSDQELNKDEIKPILAYIINFGDEYSSTSSSDSGGYADTASSSALLAQTEESQHTTTDDPH